ncbi:hypothetical protein B0H14DRAFT_2696630 [Mycena olivaceomarginata]|nr:hypothetical protein B0H14DRAFT_2696630 [Mycena olivaceomarginata]
MSNPPKLPPELECTIFEIAALARPKMIPSLILVAHRVKHWVEPLLYRVIMVVPRTRPSSSTCSNSPFSPSKFCSRSSRLNRWSFLKTPCDIYTSMGLSIPWDLRPSARRATVW